MQKEIPERFECNPGPSLTDYSENICTTLDAFLKLFDEKAIEIVVKNTNLHAQGDREWVDLTNEEFLAFLGIFVVIGITKSRKRSLESLWSTDYFFNIRFYNAVFGLKRFKAILSHLRFDDSNTRTSRVQETGDKLQAVRNFSDVVRENCMKAYNPSKRMTVDERLHAFRGNYFGKVFMALKPGKFGVKLWVICDTLNSYAYNFQVYFPGKFKKY